MRDDANLNPQFSEATAVADSWWCFFNANIVMRALNWLLTSWFGDVNLCQKAFPYNVISILKAFLFNSATKPIHFL